MAGNVPGRTWRDRAKAIDQHGQTARPEVVKPLHRTSLRVSEADRKLTDREWKQVANEYIERMGFDKCPWEATRHADDHIHITVNRVQWDGKLANTSHDYAKAQAASRHIEKAHGLEDASRKFKRERPQISKGEKESAERRQVTPEREQLRDKLARAERASNGTRASYEQKLTEHGVEFRANVSKTTGRVSGYSYGLDGHTASPKGEQQRPQEQVWFKGSQLGRDYSWNKTQERLTEQQRSSEVNRETDRPATPRTPPASMPERQPATSNRDRSSEDVGQPMTREQARKEAARRAAERQPRSLPATARTNQPTAQPTGQGRPSPMTQGNEQQRPMTREQAQEEAARRAAERQREQERNRDQDKGRGR
ncbi:relaxase/mobilization nuclease domain-containing protein [Rhodococcus sp. KBW08]|uniref:relaxase/mobilization nuclease domain-containing protein n=1 Tax=Rhodococcus sp. KBW08 TaxID=2144188 RepID=UPI000F5ADB08|nr:hypothetical protein [Rhodococcus sp. KBW08]